MNSAKLTLALSLLCAFLTGVLARDLLVVPARAEEQTGFRAHDVRELLRAIEKNTEATKDVAESVRALKR